MLYEVSKPADVWWWLFPMITAVSGFAGGIFGSFFSKRGEIAAIKSQMNTVVQQNERLVKSSEEIKSDISQRDWSKQQRWDMQRDIGIETMRLFGKTWRTLGKFGDMSIYYNRIMNTDVKTTKEYEKQVRDEFEKAQSEMLEHLVNYWQLVEVSRLVFSPNVQSRLEEMKESQNEMFKAIGQFQMVSDEKYAASMRAILAKEEALATAIRVDLGFDSTSTRPPN